jgi:hypothetical protein
MSESYTTEFYDFQEAGSKASAGRVVPILVDLLHPRSVIDVGCGVGYWLATFKSLGTPIVHGVDGPWIVNRLRIDPGDFTPYDFASERRPFNIGMPRRRYDLAISFEFLEHLGSDIAPDLVAFLCDLSDVVAVSAAVPGQGGTNHVNEQWPEYWVALFRERGYVPCDILRPALWNIPDVEPWYAQNSILYFKDRIPGGVLTYAQQALARAMTEPRSLVHPALRTDLLSYPANTLLAASMRKMLARVGRLASKRT